MNLIFQVDLLTNNISRLKLEFQFQKPSLQRLRYRFFLRIFLTHNSNTLLLKYDAT